MYLNICTLAICILFVSCVLAKQDLYVLLGIERDATTKQIRKAFKELAVKLHPDKNPDDENADEKFVEIVKAYEILKDPETRKRYDLHGDTGDDSGQKQEYYSYTYYRDQFGIYDDDPLVITLTKADFELNILDNSEAWFVNFYSPNCHHCHELASTWRKLSRDFDGIIKVAAVNCEDDWVLCHQQKIRSFPSLVYFKKETHQLHEGSHYEGPRTFEDIQTFILSHMTSEVKEITPELWEHQGLKNEQWLLLLCTKDNIVCPEKDVQLKLVATLEGLMPVGVIEDESLCDDIFLGHRKNPIVFWKLNGDKTKMTGDVDVHSIDGSDVKEIVDKILTILPHPPSLNKESFQDIRTRLSLGDDTPWVICFYLGTATELNLQLKRLPSLLPQMQIGLIHCGKETTLCSSLHISHYPAWGIIKSGGAFEMHHGRDILHEIVAFAKDSSKSTNLHALSPADFYAQVKDGSNWFIDWFAPWCPPCRKLMPEIRKASQHFDAEQVKFGTIDCTLHTSLCVQEGIKSYPTTALYRGNQIQYFHGIPNEESIVDFVEDMLNPRVIDLNRTSFMELVKKPAGELWMVDFFAPWCAPCQRLSIQWRVLAKQVSYLDFVKIAQLNCEANEELCQNQNVRSYPTIRLYPLGSKGMNTVAMYNGNRNVLSMKQWLHSFLPSPVETLTAKEFKKEILSGNNYLPWLVDFYAPWCGHCINFEPDYISVAQRMEGYLRSGKLDCEAERTFCRELRVTSYPTVILFLSPTDRYEVQGRETNEIVTEIKDVLARRKHTKDEL